MLRMVDRDPQTGLEIFKVITFHNGKEFIRGYRIGKAERNKKGKLVLSMLAGSQPTLRGAREFARIPYTPPVKETMPKAQHAARDAAARHAKPKRG